MADREDIAYISDIDDVARIGSGTTPVQGNLVAFGADGKLTDSQKSAGSLVTTEDVTGAVDDATQDVWAAVKGVDAVRAYNSSTWAEGKSYAAGSSYCIYGGEGYKCVDTHVSGQAFESQYWKKVLTSEGKAALTSMLSGYSTDGFTPLESIAPEFSGDSTQYGLWQLAVKNGKIVVCTHPGAGADPGTTFMAGTVEESVKERIEDASEAAAAALSAHADDGSIHVTAEQKAAWNAKQPAISDLEQIRTGAAAGTAAAARDKVVVSNGSVSAKHADDSGSVDLATRTSVDKKADVSAIDDEYSTTSPGYSEGDTCTHDGKWWRCVRPVAPSASWNSDDWEEITVKGAIAGGAVQEQADWNETSSTSPSYIKNKPAISTPYKMEQVSALNPGDEGYSSNSVSYRLKDRTVNYLAPRVGISETIRLLLPQSPGEDYARDFYVVIYALQKYQTDGAQAQSQSVEQEELDVRSSSSSGSGDSDPDYEGNGDEVEVEVPGASLMSYDSRFDPSSLTAVLGEFVSYRFLEAGAGSTFLVTGFTDPAYQKAREIEGALDAILAEFGYVDGKDYVPSVYVYDSVNKRYHKLSAVQSEDGEVNIGVDQTGVAR